MNTVIFFVPDSHDQEDISILKEELHDGSEFKFVFEFRARVLAQELCMFICIARTSIEHEIMHAALGEITRRMPDRGFGIEINPYHLGGGYVKMENGRFIFYDSSSKFGKYNKDYLSLGKQEIAALLGVDVDSVEFQ